MTNFFDWLTASDSGLSADGLAERFRLSHEEMRRTSEALAPAFFLALQKTMLDPTAWSELSSRFAAFMPGNPLYGGEMPTGRSAENLLDGLFGSKALTAAIARHVSMASGLAPDTVEKLMPGLAIMTIEAMVRTMASAARSQPQGLATGDYGSAVAEMMRRGANAVEAMNRPSGTPAPGAAPGGGRAFGSDYLEQMFAGALKGGFPWIASTEEIRKSREHPGQAGAGPEDSAMPNPFLPFAAMAEAFARGMQPQSRGDGKADEAQATSAGPETPADAGKSATPAADADRFLDEMMRSGQKLQDDYAREMMALFERYHSVGKRGGGPD